MRRQSQRAANASYYRRNRAREIERVRCRQDAPRDSLRRLRFHPCADCGARYRPHQMDFDHRDPIAKAFRLTSGGAMLASRRRLDEEIAKCDIVCANCHRVRTWRRQNDGPTSGLVRHPSVELERKRRYWRKQARILDDLKHVPCADCGSRYRSCAMDFDHREPSMKRYTISRMVGRAGTAKIIAEVAKCDIVCSNCHRDRTYRRREAGSP